MLLVECVLLTRMSRRCIKVVVGDGHLHPTQLKKSATPDGNSHNVFLCVILGVHYSGYAHSWGGYNIMYITAGDFGLDLGEFYSYRPGIGFNRKRIKRALPKISYS